ncbi:IS110 family transposase [Brevibacillus dissolubilis]|uniref:IS110 family transposase n=1 Tax=Brevibacillus dissolubilis TaxID=1844116 RepID=UPI00111798FC|nr:IS110 family transposase [Brevibacillus dissolubilis]
MHQKQKHIYIGVDLHKRTHTAVIVNCWHEKLGEIQFDNSPSAFRNLIKEVKKYQTKGLTPVFGLEDVGGYGRSLAIFLLEEGHIVKEVNTALSYAERRSYPTTQKSDSWDAECLARILVNKLDTLPDANPHDLYWAIGQLVTRRTGLVKALTALKNQLHAQLSYHYPSYDKFFSVIDGKTALAFWDCYPAPHHLQGVTVEQLAQFLRNESNNALSTKKAEQILSLVEADGDTKREFQESRDFLIRSHVRDIRFKQQEIAHIEAELTELMKLLDVQLHTLTGVDIVMASALVAEIGDINRFPSPDKLARFAGVAPVHFSSGGKGRDKKSKQGNRVLHGLLYSLAVQQIQVARGSQKPRNPLFHEYYHRKIAEGKTKGQALVCVMRRLVNIVYGMMKNKTPYTVPPLPETKAG